MNLPPQILLEGAGNGVVLTPDLLQSLPRKQRKKVKKKLKRKLLRQQEHEEQEVDESVAQLLEHEEYLKAQQQQQEHEEQERQWLEREKKAQEEFEVERQRQAQQEKVAEEKRLAAEERRKKREEEKLAKQNEKSIFELSEDQLSEMDKEYLQKYGTEKDPLNCSFYLKTGSCRYGNACGKKHPYPTVSRTIMIKNMYDGLGMTEQLEEDAGDDLAHEESEITKHFREFYFDVIGEFEKQGKLVQFKVCRNNSSHLRGNVYAQYETLEDAVKAFHAFSGRYYAGKQLTPEFVPIMRWKSAICGVYDKGACPKGKQCNFLHVFRNPGGAYRELDRDSEDRKTYTFRNSQINNSPHHASDQFESRKYEVHETTSRKRSKSGKDKDSDEKDTSKEREQEKSRRRDSDYERDHGRDRYTNRDRKRHSDYDDRDRRRDRERYDPEWNGERKDHHYRDHERSDRYHHKHRRREDDEDWRE